jgi:putative flippase GtrA
VPFLAVGGTAALVHQIVVVMLVESRLLEPAWANVPGFLSAWIFSYIGHRTFTFRSNAPHSQAAPRFFLISLGAFSANQGLYMAFLHFTPLHYAVALFITLLAVAAGTFVLSRSWAFANPTRVAR